MQLAAQVRSISACHGKFGRDPAGGRDTADRTFRKSRTASTFDPDVRRCSRLARIMPPSRLNWRRTCKWSFRSISVMTFTNRNGSSANVQVEYRISSFALVSHHFAPGAPSRLASMPYTLSLPLFLTTVGRCCTIISSFARKIRTCAGHCMST
ncbi:hypothetical protein BDN67DRAFT_973372 [Paxillus ammoniavirescens]|nr:hypothetical protein BDN67DRAFT_973372 [Paxillus ammoniavirescens]